METVSQKAQAPADFLPLRGIDHIELWVGNARQAAHFYRTALGFDQVAYAGLETGVRDRASYVMEQGKIRLVLTAPLGPQGELARHVHQHGDGVRAIALEVDDAAAAFRETVARGAIPAAEPAEHKDEYGVLRTASIFTYGETLHTFVERHGYKGVFAPGYLPRPAAGQAVGLAAVDHVVGNVELGNMDRWVEFYKNVMGFSQFIHFDDKDISTEYSALMSKVMQHGQGKIKFPINEPAEGRRKSQIQEFLDYYGGPGVQHIALLTGDILKTVSELRQRGLEFLRVPAAYYDELPRRVGPIDEAVEALRELGILVDRDEEGYLLQIFTRPVQDRPTLFFEVIQRKGSRGFGKGNFKALFEALEREQAARGNL
jgi:4-hydroxyphenylpyruvate dioxygenase